MNCRNPDRKRISICLCPPADRGYGPRQVLASKFINGWLSEGLMSAANALAADDTVSEERLWRMVFTLEDYATDAYELWKQCQ